MKKISLLVALFITGLSNAQISDTCEVWFNDTVMYIDAKTSVYSGIGINQINAGGSYGYAGYAQKFEAPDTVTVKGMCFYGVMDSGSSFTAAVKMYDGSSGSPGAMIAGTTHVIPYLGGPYTSPMNDPLILQCAMFSTPVQWEGDYFLGIENFSSSDMYIARNADGDGAAEGLSYTYYKGVSDQTWDGWYDMYSFGAGWDFDLIIRPVVSYEVTSVLSYDSLLCFGDTLFVEYKDSINDSLMYNKFYNPNFSVYNGANSSHTFDYGDLTSVTTDTFHVYTSGGARNVVHSLNVSHGGWSSSSSMLNCDVDVNVVDPYFDVLDQSACAGNTIYFVANPGYDSYLWDDMSSDDSLMVETTGMINGDYNYYIDFELSGCASSDTMTLTIGDLAVDLGSDTTLCLNESVLLSPGTYDSYEWNTGQNTPSVQIGPFVSPGTQSIVVEVGQGGCIGADTLVVTVDNCLGVDDLIGIELSVYPNPTNGVFTVKSPIEFSNVKLFNMVGEKVFDVQVTKSTSFNCSNLPEGVYLVQVETKVGVVSKKIQIIQ